MAKIDVAQFLGKPKEYRIGGQSVWLETLTGDDLDLITELTEGKPGATKKLVMHVLEITNEEFNKLPLPFLNEAVEAILDINGLKKKKEE